MRWKANTLAIDMAKLSQIGVESSEKESAIETESPRAWCGSTPYIVG